MFIARTFSFIIIVPLFIYAVYWTTAPAKYLFMVFAVLLGFQAVNEYLKMLSLQGWKSYRLLTSFFGMLFIISSLFESLFIILLPEIIIFWLIVIFSKDKKESLKKIIVSSSALIVVAYPLSALVSIHGILDGNKWLLYLILVTKAGDTGAYIAGTISSKLMSGGNHKIVPSISPKKSWEGTLGGLAFSIIISIIIWGFLGFSGNIFIFPLLFGFLFFWGGFAGDLAESCIKRACGVKDSGNIIPGMGGVLDILDSLMINSLVFVTIFVMFRKFL